MSRPHAFVVIPVHNRLPLTRECLASLGQQSTRDLTVVVVNDGSDDGTGEALEQEFPAVTVLDGNGSLWWTGATNVGVRWAMQQASRNDVVVTLNNDTVPLPHYIAHLMAAHESRPNALVGSLLVRAADHRTIVDGGVRVHWPTAKFTSDQQNEPMSAVPRTTSAFYRVDVLSGCGTLVPISAYRKVGLYDEIRLRHYGADYEFSRRALEAGFPLWVDKTSTLYLHEDKSGLHLSVGHRDMARLLRSFWSLSSANDLRLRWRFARRACPARWQPSYIPCDYVRVIVGSVRRHWTSGG